MLAFTIIFRAPDRSAIENHFLYFRTKIYVVGILKNRLNKTILLSIQSIIEPRYEISNNLVCATSKGSDQPAHIRSLIRAFASRLNIL